MSTPDNKEGYSSCPGKKIVPSVMAYVPKCHYNFKRCMMRKILSLPENGEIL